MKKIFSLAIALVTLFTVASTNANAGNFRYLPIELKLVGNINNEPVFQLSHVGTPGVQDEFTVVIRDESGSALYRETIKGEGFSKKFMVNSEEIGDGTIRFEITSKKNPKAIVYEVNRNTRQVEDLVINKL